MNKILGISLILFILAIIITYVVVINNTVSAAENELEKVQDINYTESTEKLNNPDRGFYTPVEIIAVPTGTPVKNPKDNLVHLRVGIQAFGKSAGNLDFTSDMLNSLNQTLENIRNNGGTVILRFAYDNFVGTGNLEPSIDQIVKHVGQLKPLFETNEDIITSVESGFFGLWGEQHGSTIISKENFKKLLDALIDAVPESRSITVRQPKFFADYVGININQIDTYTASKGSNAYRIGLYNDGYLGSETDLGTYQNREKEITWLESQAKHTVFGGEVVSDRAGDRT